jgi:hypothetical protein
MRDAALIVDHHRSHFGGNDRSVDIDTRERFAFVDYTEGVLAK